MKKKLIAIVIAGVMMIGSCISVMASVNSTIKHGSTAAFNATGKITVDNVNNMATATVDTSQPCDLKVTAIIRYSNGQLSSGERKSFGTTGTAKISKEGVQVVGATGIFVVTKNGHTWSDVADVSVK